MTQSTAPIHSARHDRTPLVGLAPPESTPTYAVAVRTGRALRRPGVLRGNEALFPDRARCFAAGGLRG